MGKIFFGYWDCESCYRTGIKGNIKNCPACGKRADENTEYYATNKREYVPKEEESKINKNPDWICEYCNQINSDIVNTCYSCGAKRGKNTLDYFQNRIKQEERKQEKENLIKEAEEKNKESDIIKHLSKLNLKNNPKFIEVGLGVLITILFIALIVGFISCCMPKKEEVTVDSFLWNREINIEKYKTVSESGWQLPSDARLKYTNEEFYEYQQVLDHYETKTKQVAKERIVGYDTVVVGVKDLGNGYFEEITNRVPIYETYYDTVTYQEPVYKTISVYKTKYYYDIDKWVFERSVKTSGEDKNPYWGEFTLENNEREGSKNESYKITGTTSKDKNIEINLNFEDWDKLEQGLTYTFEIDLFGYGKLIQE